MKHFLRFAWCVLLGLLLPLQAQDLLPSKVGSPAPQAQPNSIAPAPTPTPLPTGSLGLIPAPLPNPSGPNASPPAAPELPDLSQLNQIFQQSAPGKQVQEYRAHVEWRQLKSRTMYDPAVVAAKDAAAGATTDLEKRKLLHAYYETFYQRMRAHASTPAMVDYLNAARDAHFGLLAQPRVRPTPESEATPSRSPSASPAPAPALTPPPLPSPEPTLTPLELPH